MQYVQILLPKPHLKLLTYRCEIDIELGSMVKVPFRNLELVGVVWQIREHSNITDDKIKMIISRLDLPSLSALMLDFVESVASYNVCDLGNVLKMVLPIDFEQQIITEQFYILAADYQVRMSEARRLIIEYMQNNIASIKQICADTKISRATVNNLIKQQVLIESSVPDQPAKYQFNLAELSKQQQQAADFLLSKIESFNVTLLDGITGSGKTEVYFFIIAYILERNLGQVLILLPEILLTAQLIQRFSQRFGFKPCLWHSGLSVKQRRINWHLINQGTAPLVIGARSALFLPFKNLKMIIIDEEHETSYKQEDNVNYQARDMAILRASKQNISVILSSATPSLETINNYMQGKYGRIKLESRHGKAAMPEIHIADMRSKKIDNGYISADLKQAIAENLTNNQQILLYLNRRGYAPLTLCKACGFRFTCLDCSSWLVEHKAKACLECHHCGFRRRYVDICPECQEADSFVACGPGVERIEEEIAKSFPDARILIITKDNVDSAVKAEHIMALILNRHIDIIIGTQVVAKGHHFPALALVGIIDADLGLMGGDLRAAEKSYQLMHQVGGRAGRENVKGTVIIQTYNPNNLIIKALAEDDRDQFMAIELNNRKMMQMPPFSRLVAIIISGMVEDEVKQYAKYMVRQAEVKDQVIIMGRFLLL